MHKTKKNAPKPKTGEQIKWDKSINNSSNYFTEKNNYLPPLLQEQQLHHHRKHAFEGGQKENRR